MDTAWRPALGSSAHVAGKNRVCIDEGHYNAHTATGRYRPLALLLESEGYSVNRHKGRVRPGSLVACDILVIANAAGGDRFKLGPINLPITRGGGRGDPAFDPLEIRLLRQWVAGGKGLLLVADHAPFGQASRGLSQAFGVAMGGGFVEVPHQAGVPYGETDFTAANGLLRPHPITLGLSKVATFTGQSLSGAGTPLLALPPGTIEYVPPGPELKPTPAAGRSQAIALDFGAGRMVVLGEAGMLSAQIDDNGKPMGMNVPGNQNEAFARNLFRWLRPRQ